MLYFIHKDQSQILTFISYNKNNYTYIFILVVKVQLKLDRRRIDKFLYVIKFTYNKTIQ